MSQIYNLEPPTSGSVILETTHGPLHINLWSVESATTARNFIQHCLNGYYDDLPFHRIIPNVLIQTGDPTRSGSGGTAAIGDPKGYPQEQHGRLKFRRRGLVAMVCEDGLARSQFFITLAATEWLNGSHTIFGEVAGDTIYNLLNIGEKAVDGFDVEGAPRVKAVKILENPFAGMVAKKVVKVANVEKTVNAKVAIRSRNLLSFTDDSDDDDDCDGEVVVPRVVKRPRSRFGDRENGGGKDVVSAAVEPVAEEEDEVIREANAEFARLKAQLEQDVVETGFDERKGDSGVRERGKKRRDESGTLRRLKAFENRVKKSRKDARVDEHGRIRGAWFERGLRLGTMAMEEEEYEVHFGTGRRR